MKKVVLFILLMVLPIMILEAKCDATKHQEYAEYASKVTYDNSYSKSTSRFTVTLYNVVEGLRVKYNNIYYTRNSDDTVTIPLVQEGTNMKIEIYDEDEDCQVARIFYIRQLYYNDFYGKNECSGYEGKINSCTAQFTTTKVTKESLAMSKKNYNVEFIDDDNKKVVKEKSTMDIIIDFMLNWGIKILLLVITCVGSFAYYNDKFRKIKHGI